MRKLLLLFSALFLSLSSFSQDLNTPEAEVHLKTEEVTDSEISNRDLKDQEAVNTSPETETEIVVWEEESNEGFNKVPESDTVSNLPGDDLFMKGQSDAITYYNDYKGAGTGTLITALISPLGGLVPAIATSSTTPKKINLNYPDAELIKNQEYYDGYTQRAKKIKQGKVWKNWGIAFGANVVAVLLLASQ